MAITIRQRRKTTGTTPTNTFNLPQSTNAPYDISAGFGSNTTSLMGAGTTLTDTGGVQGVEIPEMPKGYIESIQFEQQQRDRKRQNTLFLEYYYNKNPQEYLSSLGEKDARLLNEAIEKSLQIRQPEIKAYKPEEIDQDLTRKYELKERAKSGEGVGKEIEKALDVGVGQVFSGVGGALKWAGAEELGQGYNEVGQKRINEADFKHPITQEFSMEQLGDPRFWSQKFPQSIPFMITGAEAGLIGGAVGLPVAGTVGLGAVGTTVTTGIFAGLSSRAYESLMEAGGTYNEAIDQGLTPEQASKASMDTFKGNMKLAVTDAGQFIATFAPLKIKGTPKHIVNALKIPTNYIIEGSEEVYQGYISENALSIASGQGEIDKKEYLNRPSTLESFTLGGVTGGLSGTAGVISDYLGTTDKILQQQMQVVEKYAKEGNDQFLTNVEYAVINGDISESYGKALKDSYVRLKEYFKEKAYPVVEKIAEKTGAKTNFISNEGQTSEVTDNANKVFRGGEDFEPSKTEGNKLGEGVYVTYSEKQGQEYADQKGTQLLEGAVDKGLNFKEYKNYVDYNSDFTAYLKENNIETTDKQELDNIRNDFNETLKEEGYDGIDLNGPKELLVFDKNNITSSKTEAEKFLPELEKAFESYDIDKIEEAIQSIEEFPETIKKDSKITEAYNALNQQKKFIISSAEKGKHAGLQAEYGTAYNALSGLYINHNRASDKTRSKYTEVEQNYPGPASQIQEYIEQYGLDKTVQEVWEEFADKKDRPAKSIVKKPKFPTLEKIKTKKDTKKILKEKEEITETNLFVTEEKELINEVTTLLNDTQKVKAIFGFKDNIKSYPKFLAIKTLQNLGIIKYKGIDKQTGDMKFEFTPQADQFKIDKDFLKKGVHYNKTLFDQISNKEKQLKPAQKKNVIQRIQKSLDTTKIQEADKIIEERKQKIDITKTEQKQIKGTETKKEKVESIEKVQKETKYKTVEKIERSKQIRNLATKILNLAKKQPDMNELENFMNKVSDDLLKDALNFAVQKNMISKEDKKFFLDAIKEITTKKTQAPTGQISSDQRVKILDMLGWNSIWKKISEYKINIPELARSLKNLGARLHLVNAPEGQRVKLPFSLMGNKSMTFKKILLPMIKKATEQGATKYVEPFGGAGTVYNFAEEMIESGIEDIYVNHFDNEKYTIIEAIKENKINVDEEVNKAYGKIIDEIGEELVSIPEIQEIMDTYGVKIGSKEFKEMAELFFYPQYAKQFFQERPDTKLGVKGELSSTFKEWLKEHIQQKNEETNTKMTEEELDMAVENILNDDSVFENKYPEISKKISTILDKYDNVDFKKGDVESAMLTAMSRHLRQRGDSGQKVVSASGGFQSVIGARNKMIEGLTKYQQVFNKYGDKIHIYNMDGKKFIQEMGNNLNNNKTISYYDPPYIRTTGVYIKNQPAEIQESLQEYADPYMINQLFEPMKDSIMMFTNDINGPYFETLHEMLGDRMSKDIIGYREGTTPTSLVTTTEIAVKPKDVGLSYYQILKNQYTKNMFNTLRDNLFPKISKQMEKALAKFEQHFMRMMNEKFGDLTKIQDQVFKGAEAYKKLEESIQDIVSGRGKQELLNEAKKWVKQNKVTGAELVKMVDLINKLWVNRTEKIKEIRNLNDKLNKTETIDAQTRKEYQDWFNQNYTTTKISSNNRKALEIIQKFENTDEKLTAEEFDIYMKYLENPEMIEQASKTSLYDMDIDQLNELQKNIENFFTVGKDAKQYYEKQEKEYIDKKTAEAKQTVEAINEPKEGLDGAIDKLSKKGKTLYFVKKFIKTLGIKTYKGAMDVMPSLHVIEKLGIHRQIYDIYKKNFSEWHLDYNTTIEKFFDLKGKLKLKKESFEKIGLYGLYKRGDNKGKIKIVAYLQKKGINPITQEKITDNEQIYQFLDSINEDNFLNDKEKQMYDFMRTELDRNGDMIFETASLHKSHLVERVKDYFPIRLDAELNNELKIDPVIGEVLNNNFQRTNVKAGFLEQATEKATIPTLNAQNVFLNHIYRATYYGHMQTAIQRMNKMIEALGEESLGNIGYKYMKERVDMMARQGILETDITPVKRAIGRTTKRVAKSFVAYNPSSILVQPLALLESKISGTSLIKTFKNLLKGKKDIAEKSLTYKSRDFKHLFDNENAIQNYYDEFLNLGLAPMGFIDITSYKAIWNGIYEEMVGLGFDEETAIYYSDLIAEKSLAPTMFDGKPMYMMKHERGGTAFTTSYMTFGANRFAEIFLQGGKSAIDMTINRSKKPATKKMLARAKLKAIITTGIILLALGLYLEELTKELGRKTLNKKEYKETAFMKFLNLTIGQIPVVGSIFGGAKYGGLMFMKPLQDIATATTMKDTGKALEKGTFGIATMLGFPKAFLDFYKGYLKEESKKTSTTKKKTKINTRKKR